MKQVCKTRKIRKTFVNWFNSCVGRCWTRFWRFQRRFKRVSESELSTVLEEKDAENTKKATKVTLNIFRGYLQEKGLREAELLTSKVKLANACMSN